MSFISPLLSWIDPTFQNRKRRISILKLISKQQSSYDSFPTYCYFFVFHLTNHSQSIFEAQRSCFMPLNFWEYEAFIVLEWCIFLIWNDYMRKSDESWIQKWTKNSEYNNLAGSDPTLGLSPINVIFCDIKKLSE